MPESGNESGANWGAVAGAAISTAGNIGAGSVASNSEYHKRKKLMRMAYEQDIANWKMQNEYNSPAAQRARMEAANLNPALMYGTGSSGGGTAGPPPAAPNVPPPELMKVYGNMGTNFMDMLSTIKLKDSQTNLNNQKQNESGIKQDLMKSQKAVVDANPYLDAKYLNAVVQIMSNTADLKQSERNHLLSQDKPPGSPDSNRNVQQESINTQLQTLLDKHKLNQADQKLKAEILKSTEFKNDLQKIQVDWMKQGDITPQHIYQGILLLLSKMM